MTLEDICTIKALLGSRSAAGTEATDHGAFVVRQGVPVLIVLTSKPLKVILASYYRALFGALSLVREHVCLQILEGTATLGNRAEALLSRLIVQVVASTSSAAVRDA